MAGLWVKSSIGVPPGANFEAIVAAAGGQMVHAMYDAGTGILTVRGVEQADLDAAVQGVLDPLHGDRATKLSALDAKLDALRVGGMPYQGKLIKLDEESLSDINRMVTAALAGQFPSVFAWRTIDNTFLPLDAAGMQAMGTAALMRMNALLMHYWTLKDTIRFAPDEASIAAVNIEDGWPAPTTG